MQEYLEKTKQELRLRNYRVLMGSALDKGHS